VGSALVAALLETAAAAVRSSAFKPVPLLIYVTLEFLFFAVVISCAAFIVTRRWATTNWVRKVAFFTIVVTPPALSHVIFFYTVSYYRQGGSVMVQGHHLTIAGMESLALGISISAAIALIVTIIYFRGTSLLDQGTPE